VLLRYQSQAPPPMTAMRTSRVKRTPRQDFMRDFYGRIGAVASGFLGAMRGY
jgi:hypothetical protein